VRGRMKNCGRGLAEVDDPIGVEPGRMRSNAPNNPARGKAQGRIDPMHGCAGCGSQTGVKPRSPAPRQRLSPRSVAFWISLHKVIKVVADHPDENPSGRTRGDEGRVGPILQKCRVTRLRE